MADFGAWRCPLCGHEDEAEYVVDPDFGKRITAHKQAHLDRLGGHENVLAEWRRQLVADSQEPSNG